MAIRILGQLMVIAGCLGAAASVAYWYWFYLNVLQALGERGTPPTECLLASNGPCSLIVNAVRLMGQAPYEPHFLWISIALFVFGILVIALSPRASRRLASHRREPNF